MEDEIRNQSDAPKPELPNSDALGALLSNPALLTGLMTVLGGPTGERSETEGATLPTAVPTGDGLSSLLSNPALLARLPQVMAAIKPMMEKSATDGKGEGKELSHATPAICREQLLLALKPFLSRERCEAVDTLLRISKLGAVFQMLK